MRINNGSLIAALALGGLVACSSLAIAQEGKAPKGKRGMPSVQERVDRMSKELNLTDEQKPKVEAVIKETDKKMMDLAPEDRRTKGREIRTEQDKKFKEILTHDQYTKWEKMRNEMRQRRGGKQTEGEQKKAAN